MQNYLTHQTSSNLICIRRPDDWFSTSNTDEQNDRWHAALRHSFVDGSIKLFPGKTIPGRTKKGGISSAVDFHKWNRLGVRNGSADGMISTSGIDSANKVYVRISLLFWHEVNRTISWFLQCYLCKLSRAILHCCVRHIASSNSFSITPRSIHFTYIKTGTSVAFPNWAVGYRSPVK